MRSARYIPKLTAILAAIMLAACGQTGALYLPEQPEQTPQQEQADQTDQDTEQQ